ncbi:MAG: hypothetical protein RI885_448 [Actinomycetota bacterium]
MHDDVDQLLARILDHSATASELESQEIEFKTDGRSVGDDLVNLADAASCFANARGGLVVVGVADAMTGPDAFIGTKLEGERTRLRIYEITQPPLLVESNEHLTPEGKRVLVLRVAESTQVHISNGRGPTERIGTSCMPMTTDRISAVIAQKTGRDWSAADSGLRVDRVDPVAIQVARELLGRSADLSRRRLAGMDDVDVLRAVGVVLPGQTLTNAGALLFSRRYDDSILISYAHRRTPAGQLSANEQITGPLIVAVQKAFDLISSRLETTPVSIGKGQQLHVADLPEAAVREAVVNALMHREYFSSDRISIDHTLTQLRVTSPGGFIAGVNVENLLTTSSRTRNTNLAGALRMLGLAETAGSGVDRMYAEMARLGHQPPRFQADPTQVEVTLMGGAPNTNLARYVSTLPTDEAADADTMVILLTLLTSKTVTAAELTPLLQKASVAEAQSVLARLSGGRMELLEPTRETARRAQPRYRLREEALSALGAAVSYRRRTTDQVDRKIIDLITETQQINGRMVKVLLDLDTVSASRVLADLVDRGILVKTSEATRGPSVTYGRGPAFPTRQRARPSGSAKSRVEPLPVQQPLEGL